MEDGVNEWELVQTMILLPPCHLLTGMSNALWMGLAFPILKAVGKKVFGGGLGIGF